jgi:small subunit ribosomal protein S2
MRDKGEFSLITKKEALILERKIERLEALLGGIRKMATLPDLLFVVDVYREATAIHEANLLEIPVTALVDTNCDPSKVDYVIPSNDDAIRAIKLLVGKIADAAVEGRALRKEEEVEAMPEGMPMAIAEEPELSDEELLGEATLAKLPSRGLVAGEEEGIEELEEEGVEELEAKGIEELEAEGIEELEAEGIEELEAEGIEELEAEGDQAEEEDLDEQDAYADFELEEEVGAEEEILVDDEHFDYAEDEG